MRFYTTPHRYYCGIDLHARRMYICVLDAEGQIRVHRNGPATPEHFLTTIAPYREGLVVAVECIFTWYWLADLCAQEGIAFVLGHALYMKAIHGGKAKNDKIDAHKIAGLLRGGMLPMAYVYPRQMRATRDLLRRRCHFTRKRAELLTHIQNTASQYLLPALGKIAYHGNRVGVAEQFGDPAVRKSIETNLALVDHYDRRLSSSCTSPGRPRCTTSTPSTDCARCRGSARSSPWCCSTRSTTSTASRGCRTLCRTAAW
jgi:transposase